MKTALLTLAAITLTAGGAMAAERGRHHDRNDHGRISSYERAQIARSASHLAAVRHRVWADGRLTRFERFQLRAAEARRAAIVSRARRS